MTHRLVAVEPGSALLEEVIGLWRANAATLGFFPQGAFDEYAARHGIVAAVEGTALLGYVSYRQAAQWIVVAHLCVAPTARKRGVARALIGWLKRECGQAKGMKLRCRRDYEAHKVWPCFGFRAAGERPAKTAGEQLIDWRLDFRPEIDLFSWSAQQVDLLTVGMDQNVFLDLYGDEALVRRDQESQVLCADWLSSEINLCVTDEVFNEISRMSVPEAERQRLRSFASSHRRPHCDLGVFDDRCRELRALLPPAAHEDDGADVRHVARAIAGELRYFVTRDDALLSAALEIENRYALRVLRPAELALDIDQLLRAEEYEPRRLGGTLHKATRASADDLTKLDPFRMADAGERRADFERLLRESLDDPHRTRLEICRRPDQVPIALLATEDCHDELRISLIRTVKDRIAPTLLRYQIERVVRQAAERSIVCVRIADKFFSVEGKSAADEAGFLPVGDEWLKLQFSGFHAPDNLAAQAEAALSERVPKTAPRPTVDPSTPAIELEHLFRPAKISAANVPCFIVPIRPYWAANLFENRLAAELLHGANAELAFSPEFAYYRAARPGALSAPGRILWYVSQGHATDKGFGGRMSIRAYSRIAEVVVARPKDIFRRFRRLGVFDWRDVFETANRDLETEIMAIRCVDTELLPDPIAWDNLQRILREHVGTENQLISPLQISETLFENLYTRGFGGAGP